MNQQYRGAMTIKDFCAWASIGKTKANEERRAGRLVTFKVGRCRRITFTEAQRWLDSYSSKRA